MVSKLQRRRVGRGTFNMNVCFTRETLLLIERVGVCAHRYPRLATEILATDTPSLSDILFMPENASSQPESCPSPASILIPFWFVLTFACSM